MEDKPNSELPDTFPPDKTPAPPEQEPPFAGGAPEAGLPAGGAPAPGKAPEKKKEKPAAGSAAPAPSARFRPPLHIRVLRWLVGLLVVFGLGVVAAIFLLYLPQQQLMNELRSQLQQTNNDLAAQLKQAEDRFAGLEAQLDGMKPLEERNRALQTELDQTRLHAAILTARSDVAAAQLALARSDLARVRVALEKTPETLDQIAGLLDADQQKLVDDLRSRLELALSEAEENPFAAESDLLVLATSLLELENAYFARP